MASGSSGRTPGQWARYRQSAAGRRRPSRRIGGGTVLPF